MSAPDGLVIPVRLDLDHGLAQLHKLADEGKKAGAAVAKGSPHETGHKAR